MSIAASQRFFPDVQLLVFSSIEKLPLSSAICSERAARGIGTASDMQPVAQNANT